ncbi:MAG TPA: 1-acyl-sn-glycerol-3-phosphate acyltransferase [Paludibacter sp.]|nr:1-acyl-sn-glycerol-3-phosphate acyltransferase [Paludibacter sp.]
MSKKDIIQIDIDQVLKTKAPNTKVPKFVVNYLKKIVHQDDFNYFFRTYPSVRNIEFIEKGLEFLEVTTSVEGRENLPPKDGRYIFVSNHPLGGLDGMILGYLIGKEYDEKIRFFANDLIMYLEPLSELFIPINKLGAAQSRESAEMMRELYKSDNHLINFPAGICSRKIKGKIVDLEWKKSFVSKAIEYQRDVVPIYFHGRNSDFFYNLANLRKFLGIKFNIEMMYLADEMFKQRGNHFSVKIGKPIPWQTFDKSKTSFEWAQWVREQCYKIKQS